MINVFVAMLLNAKSKRWHPVVFSEFPLPGGAGPTRHKSRLHHTDGFDARQDAVDYIKTRLVPVLELKNGHSPTLVLDGDLHWDGNAPLVLFFAQDGDKKWRPAF